MLFCFLMRCVADKLTVSSKYWILHWSCFPSEYRGSWGRLILWCENKTCEKRTLSAGLTFISKNYYLQRSQLVFNQFILVLLCSTITSLKKIFLNTLTLGCIKTFQLLHNSLFTDWCFTFTSILIEICPFKCSVVFKFGDYTFKLNRQFLCL